MIAVIDYDAGNIRSVEKALAFLGAEVCVTREAGEIRRADKVILPGVGAFGAAMERLKAYGLVPVIRETAAAGTPLLGICLGLQLLFAGSAESPGVAGLRLLPGEIRRFPAEPGLKIPHMGWNSLTFPRESRLFAAVSAESYVYFVHSYYLQAPAELVTATAEYGGTRIHAAIEQENIMACQFHPEKSGAVGLQILKNFIGI